MDANVFFMLLVHESHIDCRSFCPTSFLGSFPCPQSLHYPYGMWSNANLFQPIFLNQERGKKSLEMTVVILRWATSPNMPSCVCGMCGCIVYVYVWVGLSQYTSNILQKFQHVHHCHRYFILFSWNFDSSLINHTPKCHTHT